MTREELEKQVLQRLNDGLLDGIVGKELTFGDRTNRAYIENGQPILSEYSAGATPSPETLVVVKEFETDEGKLWFLRNHGWKMEDVYACLYSHKYKRTGSL